MRGNGECEMKQFIKEAGETGRELRQWLGQNLRLCLFTVLVCAVCHTALLVNSQDILTDTEYYIMEWRDSVKTFVGLGRFGLLFTKLLFRMDGYTPFLFILFMMGAMILTCLAFDFFLAQGMQGKNSLLFYAFNALYLTSPVFPHQFYFGFQAFEVAFAFLLCVTAAFCAFSWAWFGKSPWWCVPAAGLMIWGFSTYQVLVPFYIAVNASVFVLYYLEDQGKRRDGRGLFSVCIRLAAMFAAGLAGYLILARVSAALLSHMAGTGKLFQTYSRWGSMELSGIAAGIRQDLVRVLAHELPAYSRFYLPVTVLFFLLCLFRGWRAEKKGKIFLLLAAAVTVFSTFFMTFVVGGPQILRAQLVYPFVLAFCSAALVKLVGDRKILTALLCVFFLFSGLEQTKTANRYYEAMHLTALQDQMLAEKIYAQTQSVRDPADEKAVPFVFIGGRKAVETPSNRLKWDALGASIFEIDPTTRIGSVRIVCLMNSLGLPASYPTDSQYARAKELSRDMPCYPAEGSILFEEGMIIVKLSE
ncbi:hypothetical protein CL3_27280 [butyrate-producing bacterium SM4/1]|nr:hypothetical protein CL3_27280 [butyrate-producing bacterium SM4/1]